MLALWPGPNGSQILKVPGELFRNGAVIHVQALFARSDQPQLGEHLEMMRQRGRGDGMLAMYLAAEKLIMLGDVGVNGEPIRVPKRPSNLGHLVIGHFSHI